MELLLLKSTSKLFKSDIILKKIIYCKQINVVKITIMRLKKRENIAHQILAMKLPVYNRIAELSYLHSSSIPVLLYHPC